MEDLLKDEIGSFDTEKIMNRIEELKEELYIKYKYNKEFTNKQKKMIKNELLPKIALYKALTENVKFEDRSEKIFKKYLLEKIAIETHKNLELLETHFFFYEIFRHRLLRNAENTAKVTSDINTTKKDRVYINISRCLYHDICLLEEVPEICKYFCESENVSYCGLHKVRFSRTTALGMGDEVCDLKIYKIRKGQKTNSKIIRRIRIKKLRKKIRRAINKRISEKLINKN